MTREELVNAIIELADYEITKRIFEEMAKESYKDLVIRLYNITLSLKHN